MQQFVLDTVYAWVLVLGWAVFYYVLFDGFDLGVGMLYGFQESEESRGLMMNSIGPIWDGNETWLVLGGLGLLVAFPLAYSIIIPAVYFPILIMLLGLIFRGVAFEFRFKHHEEARRFWDRSFCVGSMIATFAQGVILGTFIQGFAVTGRVYTGGSLDWVTPFALVCGLCLMVGYGLLGAGWLILKTEGTLQEWARRAARVCLVGTAAAILIVSIWTAVSETPITTRWFPNLIYLWPVPLLTAALVIGEWMVLARDRRTLPDVLPFLLSMGVFLLSYIGIVISLWPMIVPFHYTLWQAASSESTQMFMLVGTMFLIPVILGYTAWSYWVFRGKVRAGVGYH